MTSPDRPLRALAARLLLLILVIGGVGALLGSLVVPAAVAVNGVVTSVDTSVFDIPPLPDVEPPPENTKIFASDGTELAEIYYEEQRVPVTIGQVPEVTQDAVVATEDAAFWEHHGVNHRAILRAALANVRAGGIAQGASTITQQYVKNTYLTTDRTLNRKLKEALYAVEVEKRLSKSEILERYLNQTYFGSGVYGIGTAAQHYFDKDVSDLDLPESALLAGIIRSPESNNPEKHPEAALERRNIVLDQMAEQGLVSQAQAERAKNTSLGLQIRENPPPEQPFFVQWVTRLLQNESTAEGLGTQVDALRAMGATPEERIRTVFQGGLRIYTTIDPEFQADAKTALDDHLIPETDDPVARQRAIAEAPMGAIVSVEPGSGAIRTMAVGPKTYGDCEEPIGYDDAGRALCDKTKFNPVVPADAGGARVGRQPGSSFKPYLITAALEAGIPPGWQIDATGPQTIPGCDNGGPWRVNNSGGNGLRDMYSGVKASSNVFHARLIKEVGPEKVVEMAHRLGIRSDIPAACAIALGAAEVFPLEHAAAYATFANRGEYCAPYAIERIEDRQGHLIYQHTKDCKQVVDQDIIDRVVDIMKGPVSPGGTAPVANLGRWPTRGKTGTTNDYIDAWFVGYVKQLATAAWIGYENGTSHFDTLDDARKICGSTVTEPACIEKRYLRNVRIGGSYYSRVYGGTITAPMWKEYMSAAVERYEPEGFPDPGPMPYATVPNLLNAGSVASARSIAEEARLHLQVKQIPHWKPAGTFVSQDPPAGSRVPAGRAIVLQVSDGTATAPSVPNVVGMQQADAEKALTDAGYQPKAIQSSTSNRDEAGVVLAQSPGAGAQQAPGPGSTVVIQVGAYDPNAGKPSPSPSPSPTATATAEPSPSPKPSPSNKKPKDGGGQPSPQGG